MIKCAEYAQKDYYVESDSSDRKYRVRAFLRTEPDTCDCVAFAIARNRAGGKNHGGAGTCKHIKRVHASVCQWHEDSDIAQQIPNICPLCGGPTVDDEGGILPERPNDAAEVASQRLRSILDDLNAKQ